MKPGLHIGVGLYHIKPMLRPLILIAMLPILGGCLHVKMDPIEIHATLDVNVKVDRALDDFFGDLDKKSTTITSDTKS